MKENCDWKKCLDRIEDKGFDDDDAYSEILEYILIAVYFIFYNFLCSIVLIFNPRYISYTPLLILFSFLFSFFYKLLF